MLTVQALIFVVFSLVSPLISAGGGFLIANALTFTGVNLIIATGMASTYFLLNGVIVSFTLKREIVWKEVNSILPLAIVGAILGALFLSKVNPSFLLFCMFLFGVHYLVKEVYKKRKVDKELKITTSLMSFLSGFLGGTALPGGGLRNSYLLSQGYSVAQMHATTNFIGVLIWSIKIFILVETGLLTFIHLQSVLFVVPFLIVSNLFLKKFLENISESMTRKISIFSIGIFCLYALFSLLKSTI